MPTPAAIGCATSEADDQLRRRQVAGASGAEREVVDLAQVGLRFLRSLRSSRAATSADGELQSRGPVDEAADRGAAERRDRFLVGRGCRRGSGRFRGRPCRAARQAVADRDPLALGGDDQRLAAEFGAADREAAGLAADRGDAGGPGRRSRRPMLATVFVASLRSPSRSAPRRRRGCFRCCRRRRRRRRRSRRRSLRGRCRLASAVSSAGAAGPGRDALRVEAVDRFARSCLPNSGDGEGGERVAGQRAEQAGGVAGRGVRRRRGRC